VVRWKISTQQFLIKITMQNGICVSYWNHILRYLQVFLVLFVYFNVWSSEQSTSWDLMYYAEICVCEYIIHKHANSILLWFVPPLLPCKGITDMLVAFQRIVVISIFLSCIHFQAAVFMEIVSVSHAYSSMIIDYKCNIKILSPNCLSLLHVDPFWQIHTFNVF
jgi:hypothetical protein